MLIRTGRDGFQHPVSSEITPRAVYEDRRRLLKWMATGVAGASLATWAQREALAQQVHQQSEHLGRRALRSAIAPHFMAQHVHFAVAEPEQLLFVHPCSGR